jgi:hypothetical protein
MVDPKAEPVTFTLKPNDLATRDPALVLRGRVLDEDGDPIPHAVVEPYGFMKGKSGQYGGLTGFDPLALTDEKGEFRLGVPEKGLAVHVRVSAPKKARRNFKGLAAGPTGHALTLPDGASVTGRLVKGGKPLAGVAVGLAQASRNVETFVGAFQAATDGDGVFLIPNVPADDRFALYGLMDSLKAHGAVAVRPVKTGRSREVVDVGDVAVGPGHELTGRVVLSDGKPVPAGTRVLLAREEAWDTQQAVAGEDGTFAFAGLPAERYTLSASVKGYRPSAENAGRDLLNPRQLSGVVRENVHGLRLLYEPGEVKFSRDGFDSKEHQRRRDAPLRGAPDG